MQKFHCEECGDLDFVHADGYLHSDRSRQKSERRLLGHQMLEDVMFEICKDDAGVLQIKVEDDAADYFSQFNAQHFYNMILESVNHDRIASCPKCGEDVEIGEHRLPRQEVEVDLMESSSLLDLISDDESPIASDEDSSCKEGDSGGGGAADEV